MVRFLLLGILIFVCDIGWRRMRRTIKKRDMDKEKLGWNM